MLHNTGGHGHGLLKFLAMPFLGYTTIESTDENNHMLVS
jgi:hypothetical protein